MDPLVTQPFHTVIIGLNRMPLLLGSRNTQHRWRSSPLKRFLTLSVSQSSVSDSHTFVTVTVTVSRVRDSSFIFSNQLSVAKRHSAAITRPQRMHDHEMMMTAHLRSSFFVRMPPPPPPRSVREGRTRGEGAAGGRQALPWCCGNGDDVVSACSLSHRVHSGQDRRLRAIKKVSQS